MYPSSGMSEEDSKNEVDLNELDATGYDVADNTESWSEATSDILDNLGSLKLTDSDLDNVSISQLDEVNLDDDVNLTETVNQENLNTPPVANENLTPEGPTSTHHTPENAKRTSEDKFFVDDQSYATPTRSFSKSVIGSRGSNYKTPTKRFSSFEKTDVTQDYYLEEQNTEMYNADGSATSQDNTSETRSRSKVLKKKKEKPRAGSISSGRTPSPEALKLPPIPLPRRVPHTDAVSQTGPQLQQLLLPRPTTLTTTGRQRVLGTGLNTAFHGEMPPLLLPLDRFGLRPGEENTSPARVGDNEVPTKCLGMDVYATCRPESADEGGGVDTHVMYRAPSKKHAGQWRVDIDGAGTQVIVDFTEGEKEMQVSRQVLPPRKVKREVFSFWPKKYKVNFTPSVRRHLRWLKDEAEDKHVSRVQRASQQQQMYRSRPPQRSQSLPPSSSIPEVKETSPQEQQHVARLRRAREMVEQQRRVIAPRPAQLPPPLSLPERSKFELYEDSRAARMRDARQFYSKLSGNKISLQIVANQSRNVE